MAARIDPAPTELTRSCAAYRRMEQALVWLGENFERQPSLGETASRVGLTESHFQRVFCDWVGVSPKRYVALLTLERAKRELDRSASVLDTAFAAGLSGAGRLHDLFVTLDAMTPGEYKRRGEGLTVHYGYHASPFGDCLLLHTERGICGLAFPGSGGRATALADVCRGFERATFVHDPAATAPIVARIFAAPLDPARATSPLRLLVRGTAFQQRVWRALLSIAPGEMVSYAELARRAGRPAAMRAAGTANGANAIAYLIPCHRVIRRNGAIGGYRWGVETKLAMLSREGALVDRAA